MNADSKDGDLLNGILAGFLTTIILRISAAVTAERVVIILYLVQRGTLDQKGQRGNSSGLKSHHTVHVLHLNEAT